jgi:hypothetical protein
MIKMPWYEPLEKKLQPMQGLVLLGLLGVIGVSVYVLVKGDSIKKTGLLVYFLSP